MPNRPEAALPAKLPTMAELDAWVAREQRAVNQLIEARQSREQALRLAQEQMTALAQQVKALQDDLAQRALHIMTSIDSIDQLLLLRARIGRRAASELEATKARKSAAVDMADSAHALQRVSTRVPLAVRIGMEGGTNFFLGASENISEGGVFVATYKTRPLGDRFSIQFTLPGDDAVVTALVEVAWLRGPNMADGGQAPGMGLRFLAISPADQQKLTVFVTQRAPMTPPGM